jgi:hypothetical protein
VLRAGDLPGVHVAKSSPKAWVRAAKGRRLRTAASVGKLTGDPRLLIVTRAAVARSTRAAKKYVKRLRRLRRSRRTKLDAKALKVSKASLKKAVRFRWREGRVVGELTYVDPKGAWGRDLAIRLVRVIRERVRAAARRTAWDTIAGRAAKSRGPVSRRLALQAFSLTVARIKGVKLPPGGHGGTSSATLPLAWIAARYKGLSRRQKAAVRRGLKRIKRKRRRRVRRAAAGDQAFVDKVARELAPKLGITKKLVPMDVGVGGQGEDPSVLAMAIPNYFNVPPFRGVFPIGCAIRFTPAGNAKTGDDRKYILAHEVFHCLVAQILVSGQRFASIHPWLQEGAANYAGCTYGPRSRVGEDHHDGWAISPGRQLFGRSYDALGFFALMSRTEPAPYSLIANMFVANAAGDDRRAYQAGVTADEESLLNAWSSNYFRAASFGDDWDFGSICVPNDFATPKPTPLQEGETVPIAAGTFAAIMLRLEPQTDITHVKVPQGHLRVHGGDGPPDDKHVRDGWYCTRSGGCACPPGKHYEGPELRTLAPDPPPLVALTGGPAGLSGTLEGRDLDPYCKAGPPPPNNPVPRCPTLHDDQVCVIFDGSATGQQTYGAGDQYSWSGSGSQTLHMVWLLTYPAWDGQERDVISYRTGSGRADVAWNHSTPNQPDDCHLPFQLQPPENEGELLSSNGPGESTFHLLVPFYRNILDVHCPSQGSFYYGKSFTFVGFSGPGDTVDFDFSLTPNSTHSQSYSFTRPFPPGANNSSGESKWTGSLTAVVGPGGFD